MRDCQFCDSPPLGGCKPFELSCILRLLLSLIRVSIDDPLILGLMVAENQRGEVAEFSDWLGRYRIPAQRPHSRATRTGAGFARKAEVTLWCKNMNPRDL